MKKLLFLLCISLNTFGQINLNLQPNEEKTVEGGVYNLTMASGSVLHVKGYTDIQNINRFNNNSKIYIEEDAVVWVPSSVNLNGNAQLFIKGVLKTYNSDIQNGNNKVYVSGKFEIYQNFQILDNTSEIEVCGGLVDVRNTSEFHSQIKEGAIKLCECGTWKTHSLNNNKYNSVQGFGSFWYVNGNINAPITNSSTVYINRDCGALPVEIISFDVKYNEIGEKQYDLRLSEESTPRTIYIMESEDGINWKEVVRKEITRGVNNNFSGVIK